MVFYTYTYSLVLESFFFFGEGRRFDKKKRGCTRVYVQEDQDSSSLGDKRG